MAMLGSQPEVCRALAARSKCEGKIDTVSKVVLPAGQPVGAITIEHSTTEIEKAKPEVRNADDVVDAGARLEIALVHALHGNTLVELSVIQRTDAGALKDQQFGLRILLVQQHIAKIVTHEQCGVTGS